MNRDELEDVIAFYANDPRVDFSTVETVLDEYTRQVKAAAWDEGFRDRAYVGIDAPNPYEKEADR